MKSFNKVYSGFYDLFYRDKNYFSECNFLKEAFDRFSHKPVKTILDLGCGTGGHLSILAKRGYEVTGIEDSKHMLAIAREKVKKNKLKVKLIKGNIRLFQLGRSFDAVIAMFAVMGYQIKDKDILNVLSRVKRRLNKSGIFVFDIWLAPAVLSKKPSERVKVIKRGAKKIVRICQPALDIKRRIVKVNYTLIEAKGDKILKETKESHSMRFFFKKEIKRFLNLSGFEMLSYAPFMAIDKPLTKRDWSVSVIAGRL